MVVNSPESGKRLVQIGAHAGMLAALTGVYKG